MIKDLTFNFIADIAMYTLVLFCPAITLYYRLINNEGCITTIPGYNGLLGNSHNHDLNQKKKFTKTHNHIQNNNTKLMQLVLILRQSFVAQTVCSRTNINLSMKAARLAHLVDITVDGVKVRS